MDQDFSRSVLGNIVSEEISEGHVLKKRLYGQISFGIVTLNNIKHISLLRTLAS